MILGELVLTKLIPPQKRIIMQVSMILSLFTGSSPELMLKDNCCFHIVYSKVDD